MTGKRKTKTKKSSGRKSKAEMSAMGTKMTNLAKAYRKKHPAAKWTTAMKMAGVEYRKKHGKK